MNMAKVKTSKTIPPKGPMYVPSNSILTRKYMKQYLLFKKPGKRNDKH